MRQDIIRGEPSTYANVLMWDELTFQYVEMVCCVRGRDASEEFLTQHAPPLVLVLRVRRM